MNETRSVTRTTTNSWLFNVDHQVRDTPLPLDLLRFKPGHHPRHSTTHLSREPNPITNPINLISGLPTLPWSIRSSGIRSPPLPSLTSPGRLPCRPLRVVSRTPSLSPTSSRVSSFRHPVSIPTFGPEPVCRSPSTVSGSNGSCQN